MRAGVGARSSTNDDRISNKDKQSHRAALFGFNRHCISTRGGRQGRRLNFAETNREYLAVIDFELFTRNLLYFPLFVYDSQFL